MKDRKYLWDTEGFVYILIDEREGSIYSVNREGRVYWVAFPSKWSAWRHSIVRRLCWGMKAYKYRASNLRLQILAENESATALRAVPTAGAFFLAYERAVPI